jgi:mRNA-degrading endonuclease YafQ of YafQ-DinJ toxin-antitoxin module
MRFEFKSSFDRRFKRLSPQRQQKVRVAIETLLAYLDRQTPLRPGLGLKNFHGNYWEIRVDLHDRIIFELTNTVTFWLVGNHDEVRRFMRGR